MEDKKISLVEFEDIIESAESKTSFFTFSNLFATVVLYWHWFVLSLMVFVAAAWFYLRYAEPVYEVSARMLIKEDNSRKSSASQMLSQMEEFGFLTNSAGIENEMEAIQSRMLFRDAVKDLKLYVEYRTVGSIIKQIRYKTQPVSVDLEPTRLDSLDRLLLSGTRSIRLELSKAGKGYAVRGSLLLKGEESKVFACRLRSLPASVRTSYGTLTFTKNPGQEWKDNNVYEITITPPKQVAMQYLNNLTVKPVSKGSAVAQLSLKDRNVQRGLDFLSQLAMCYNRQANADKNEIALRTEEFINDRMTKINAELSNTEGALESFKRSNQMTDSRIDVSSSVAMSSKFSNELSEANAQIQMLDYLREYVNNPTNMKNIIPSNVGLTDEASKKLIDSYNQAVQDRNRMLKGASEEAPQVKTLTATINELLPSIQSALLQARRSADIQRQGIQSQYAKYQGRVSAAPVQERVLAQIGRQQDVKSAVYLMLLQKREENSIALAATADKGKLLDEPIAEGRVSPKPLIIMALAFLLGILIPSILIFLRSIFRYKIEGHDDVASLTTLPIIADVPVVNEKMKSAAGLVVQENTNNHIDEIFRGLRTNIQFMLKEQQKVILFTSSMPGEGKTFNSANLAASFALLGEKVILCGLDIRKPALGKIFSVSDDNHRGVTNLLTKNTVTKEALEEQILPSGVNENLDLLLAGPIPPNPAELLARKSFEQVINLLRQKYDYIILDTAPVGVVSDTLHIGRMADISIVVCRADFTSKSSFELINSLARERKLPNPSVVINGIDMSKRKYGYYYGYGRYGRYGHYGKYGTYESYGRYVQSHYGDKDDDSIKK